MDRMTAAGELGVQEYFRLKAHALGDDGLRFGVNEAVVGFRLTEAEEGEFRAAIATAGAILGAATAATNQPRMLVLC